jgi:hypothetical protein
MKSTANIRLASCLVLGAMAITACGGSKASVTAPKPSATNASSAASTTNSKTAAPGGPVLPVKDNPITNTSTAKLLKIGTAIVENNADAVTKKTVDDHLEIPVTNSGTAALSGFEVFYTVTDTSTKTSESYYTKLPDSFTIAPGATRTIHFDKSGAVDHFPVNAFGIFATSKSALAISVTISAAGAAPEVATINKDAGGAEQAD